MKLFRTYNFAMLCVCNTEITHGVLLSSRVVFLTGSSCVSCVELMLICISICHFSLCLLNFCFCLCHTHFYLLRYVVRNTVIYFLWKRYLKNSWKDWKNLTGFIKSSQINQVIKNHERVIIIMYYYNSKIQCGTVAILFNLFVKLAS